MTAYFAIKALRAPSFQSLTSDTIRTQFVRRFEKKSPACAFTRKQGFWRQQSVVDAVNPVSLVRSTINDTLARMDEVARRCSF